MPKAKTRYLLDLILSMNRSEKRNFKLLSNKTGSDSKIYVLLFDHLNKYGSYQEEKILKEIPQIKKSQLSNVKANLYKQVLRSMRDYNKETYAEIKAREKFDFAKVLYAKGHYTASLNMLNEVKKIATRIQKKPLLYLAIHFEKQIESQHVTGSMARRASQLADQSETVIHDLILSNKLSNLALTLYGIYLQRGLAKTQEDIDYLQGHMEQNMEFLKESQSMDFYQRLHLYQSYVWYYHMLQDFDNYYGYARLWVELFNDYPDMLKPETTTYIKGLHNVLNALFISGKIKQFDSTLDELRDFQSHHQLTLSRNEESQLALVSYTHGINQIFLNTQYTEGVPFVKRLTQILDQDLYPWDLNRRLVFYYKIACVYYGANELNLCIHYLNKITNHHYPDFKEDIQCFARILNLIAHYDLGNDRLVSYQVRSVYRYLSKMKEMQAVQREVFKFVRRTPNMLKGQVKEEFVQLKSRLLVLRRDKIARRPFIYLDIISYLDSKIKEIPMVEAIRLRRGITVGDL